MFTVTKFDHRGKAITTVEGISKAMITMWAMKNTSGKATSVVMDDETKEIVTVVVGRGKDNFPKVYKTKEEIESLEIQIG